MRLRTGAVPPPQEAPLSPTPPVPISVPTPLPSQPCAPHAALLCRPTRSPPAPRSHALCSAQLCPRALCHLLLPPTTLPINSGARLLPPRLCSPGNSRLQHVEPRGGLGNKPHCGADNPTLGSPCSQKSAYGKGKLCSPAATGHTAAVGHTAATEHAAAIGYSAAMGHSTARAESFPSAARGFDTEKKQQQIALKQPVGRPAD